MLDKLIVKFFSWYIKNAVSKDFSSFTFNNVEINASKSILLLANHFSWWDGFLMFRLNKRLFKKKFHVLVNEENYNKVFFLKYLGAFPIKKHSRSALESLEHAGRLLNDPENLVLIFPQGKLYSNHATSVVFEKGLLNVINSSDKTFQYVLSATFVDYFDKRKPAISCYLTLWEDQEYTSLQLIKAAYNKHYENSRQQQCRITV